MDLQAANNALRQEWTDFKSKLKPGDELRSYDHRWSGRGYQIYRNGKAVEAFFWILY